MADYTLANQRWPPTLLSMQTGISSFIQVFWCSFEYMALRESNLTSRGHIALVLTSRRNKIMNCCNPTIYIVSGRDSGKECSLKTISTLWVIYHKWTKSGLFSHNSGHSSLCYYGTNAINIKTRLSCAKIISINSCWFPVMDLTKHALNSRYDPDLFYVIVSVLFRNGVQISWWQNSK